MRLTGRVAWKQMLAISSACLATLAVYHGLGMDINLIESDSDRINALKYLTLAPPPSILSVAIGKISIVLLLGRLMGMSITKVHFWVLWIMMLITVGLSLAAVIAVLAFCIPTESIWDLSVPRERCMAPQTQLVIGLTQACKYLTWEPLRVLMLTGYDNKAFNASTDFFLGLFPSFIFWKLRMPLRRKIGLMLLLGVGVFGCVVTGIKAYQLRNLDGHDNLTGASTFFRKRVQTC
jgi:hypothetical protein